MRRFLVLVTALALALTVHLTVPRVAVACSCVAPDMVLTMAAEDPSTVVFTGEVGPAAGQVVPVQVKTWYGGPPPADIVTLQVQGGDSASCGMNPPPAGADYLFAAYENESGQLAINGCSVAADLATPEGQDLLAQADASLGPASTAPPGAGASPPPTSDPASQVTAAVPLIIVGLFLVAAVIGFVGLRRRRTDA
jgi:hypothetical protein